MWRSAALSVSCYEYGEVRERSVHNLMKIRVNDVVVGSDGRAVCDREVNMGSEDMITDRKT